MSVASSNDLEIELKPLLQKVPEKDQAYYKEKISGAPQMTHDIEAELKSPNSSFLKDTLNAIARYIVNLTFAQELLNQAKNLRNIVRLVYAPKLTKNTALTEEEENNKKAIEALATKLEKNAAEQKKFPDTNKVYRDMRTAAYLDSLPPELAGRITQDDIAYLNEAPTPLELTQNLATRRPDLVQAANDDTAARAQILGASDINFAIRTRVVETARQNNVPDPREVNTITATLRPVPRNQRRYEDQEDTGSKKHEEFKKDMQKAEKIEKIFQDIERAFPQEEWASAINKALKALEDYRAAAPSALNMRPNPFGGSFGG